MIGNARKNESGLDGSKIDKPLSRFIQSQILTHVPSADNYYNKLLTTCQDAGAK